MLDELFETRSVSIERLSKKEKDELNKGKNNVEVEIFFPEATDEEKHKIEQFIDLVVEDISFEMSFFNKKYYKAGFSDAIKLITESLKI